MRVSRSLHHAFACPTPDAEPRRFASLAPMWAVGRLEASQELRRAGPWRLCAARQPDSLGVVGIVVCSSASSVGLAAVRVDTYRYLYVHVYNNGCGRSRNAGLQWAIAPRRELH